MRKTSLWKRILKILSRERKKGKERGKMNSIGLVLIVRRYDNKLYIL